jgi:hypothetical protein
MEIEIPKWFEDNTILDLIWIPKLDISVVYLPRISKNDLIKILKIPLNREVNIYGCSDDYLSKVEAFENIYLYDSTYNKKGCIKYIENHKKKGYFPDPKAGLTILG